jgi:DNA-binding NtrC family response regulator
MRALCGYGWPGNVRELVNVVERAVLLCRGELIGLEDLPESVASFADAPVDAVVGRDDTPPPQPHPGAVDLPGAWLEYPWRKIREALLREGERAYLDALLRQTRGRIGPAAERAGFSARSLFEKMRRHGLRKEDYR